MVSGFEARIRMIAAQALGRPSYERRRLFRAGSAADPETRKRPWFRQRAYTGRSRTGS